MKKFTLIVALSTFANFAWANAQSNTTYGIGLKGGANLSRFLEDGTDNDFFHSYLAGLSLEQRLTPRVSLSYDLLYSRQGNMIHFINPGLFDRVRTKYDYLILPISFKYRLKRYPILLSMGFQVGYLLDNRTDFLPKNGYTNNNLPYLKKKDLGFSLGTGYRFDNHFLVEMKYYRSLKTLFKGYIGIDPVTGTFVRLAPAERYNQVFSLSLTYYIFAGSVNY